MSAVASKVLDTYFHYGKKDLEYGYSVMKKLLSSVIFYIKKY
jgi:hypothetical protein